MAFAGLALGPSLAQEKEKKAYKVEEIKKGQIKLIPELHLVPPGSNIIHKEISLEAMEKLKEGAKLKEKAIVDVKFFKELYEKDSGGKKTLTLKKAVFNVYQDFHDQYTDPVYFIFDVKAKE
jgi:hypothetical protein